MQNKKFLIPTLLISFTLLFTGCAELDKFRKKLDGNSGLSNSQIAAGLKEALRVGSSIVVGKLGRTNGFNNITKIIIGYLIINTLCQSYHKI